LREKIFSLSKTECMYMLMEDGKEREKGKMNE